MSIQFSIFNTKNFKKRKVLLSLIRVGRKVTFVNFSAVVGRSSRHGTQDRMCVRVSGTIAVLGKLRMLTICVYIMREKCRISLRDLRYSILAQRRRNALWCANPSANSSAKSKTVFNFLFNL